MSELEKLQVEFCELYKDVYGVRYREVLSNDYNELNAEYLKLVGQLKEDVIK